MFIDLAKSAQFDSQTACYFTWTDSTGDVRIEHYRKRRRVQHDVVKELKTKDMVQCIPAATRAFTLMPFKARCPGSYDGDCSREERSWTCINCNELLQFCPYDESALHCGCGHAKTLCHQFQFRCRHEAHGSGFAQFKDNALQEHLALSASSCGNYIFANCVYICI